MPASYDPQDPCDRRDYPSFLDAQHDAMNEHDDPDRLPRTDLTTKTVHIVDDPPAAA